jgi:4-hydroxy-tetrahydrodipicolinate synthase
MIRRKNLMDIQEVKNTLCGPMIPVITNLKDDLSVDLESVKLNVNYIVEHGIVNGKGVLLAVGAGGDFPMLTVQERKDVAKAICDSAGGRVPVLIGAQDTNPSVSLEIARFADEVGAYGIQLAPPYYYHPSDDDIFRWFKSVHDATESIAIMVYNTWWHGYNMSLEMIERLTELERVVSLKWSTPDGGRTFAKGVAKFSHRLAVVDNQGLQVLTHMLGGTGYITHLATVWPEHDLSVWGKMETGDYVGAMESFQNVNWRWIDFRVRMGGLTGGESNVVKAALELRGRPGGPCKPPTRSLNQRERAELRQILINIGVPDVR